MRLLIMHGLSLSTNLRKFHIISDEDTYNLGLVLLILYGYCLPIYIPNYHVIFEKAFTN